MAIRQRRSDRSGRGALPSPGRPSVARRENHRQFWAAIAAGCSSEDAAVEAGVSPAVGARWFRRAGGMPPSQLAPAAKPLSGRSLSFAEREEIAIWRAQRHGVREIARRLKRAPSTISRELRRNAATRSGSGVPGHDRAMARRPLRPPSQTGQAGDQRAAAALRAGPARRSYHPPERGGGARVRRAVEGAPARAAAGPTVGHGLEPGTDRPPPAARLP
jgi:DNA-binding CsgD family transcriptional regulator